MVNHILFPTDGSEASQQALPYVMDMAIKLKVPVTVLHAYEVSALTVMDRYELSYTYLKEIEKDLGQYSQQLVDKIKEELEREGIKVKTIVINGDAGHTIVETVDREHCDCIIMGTRGLGAIQSFLLGSVSHYVVHHAKCPVLLIPKKTKN